MRSQLLPALASFSALFLAAAAGQAQCNVYRSGIPDFDQRRDQNNNGALGLPNNGAMYCGPTATANIMGYIANHGFPTAFDGSGDWQSQAEYNHARGVIFQLGFLMGCSPTGGVGGQGLVDGTVDWLSAKGLGGLTFVIHHWGNSITGPTAGGIYSHMAIGGLTAMAYGRYTESFPGSGLWVRGGGHVVTVSHVYDACTSSPRLGWRDPNTPSDTESLFAQSTFATRWSDVGLVTMNISGQGTRIVSRLTDISDSTRRCIDGIVTTWPMFGLTAGPTFGKMLIIKQVPFAVYPPQQSQEITILGAGAVQSAAFNHITNTHMVLTGPPPAGGLSTVWDVNPVTGDIVPCVMPASNPNWIKVNRHGELLVGMTNLIQRYRVGGRTPVLLGSVTPVVPPEDACIDDATDELLILGQPAVGGARRIIRYSRAFAVTSNQPLPTGVTMSGDGSVIINPLDGSPWVTSHGVAAAWRLGTDAAGRYLITETASHSQLLHCASLNFDDMGHMIALCDGSVREFHKDPVTLRWIPTPGSPWAGRTGNTFLSLPFSRGNFDPVIHSGPGWENNDTIETGGEFPDCVADVDDGTGRGRPDGGVTIDDLLYFLARFDLGSDRCDLDDGSGLGHADGGVTIEDLLYYLGRFDLGC